VTLLTSVLGLAAAAGLFAYLQNRARQRERIRETFGPDVHPRTADALAAQGPKGDLEGDGLWVKEHRRELTERFRGQWIAVVGREVVAIGSSADEAWKACASSRPGRAPFVMRLS